MYITVPSSNVTDDLDNITSAGHGGYGIESSAYTTTLVYSHDGYTTPFNSTQNGTIYGTDQDVRGFLDGLSSLQKHFLVVACLAVAIVILGFIHCVITHHGHKLRQGGGDLVMSLRQRSEALERQRGDTKGEVVSTHVALTWLKKMRKWLGYISV